MFKNVSSRGTPVLRSNIFLTWEEEAFSWVRFANLSSGQHLVRWEWYEPSGNLYTQPQELALRGNGSPAYSMWNSITLSYDGLNQSLMEPSTMQSEDRRGSWQVRVYFDGELALTEDFQVVRASWAPQVFGYVKDGEHGVAVDPVRNLVYVTNNLGEPPSITFGTATVEKPYRVYVFDGDTGQVLDKIRFDYGTGGAEFSPQCGGPYLPRHVVVNPTTGRVYVEGCDVYTVTAEGWASGLNFILVPIGTLGGVVNRLAVNPTTGYVYVERFESGRVTVIGPGAATPGAVAHLNLVFPDDTGAMAVNPTTNRVYVVGNGVIYVLDGSTNQIIATIPSVFAAAEGLSIAQTTIDVNPQTNRVYVSRCTLSTERLTVIDGETNSVITTVDDYGCAVRVDPSINRIYVADLAGVRIVDGYTNMLIDSVLFPTAVNEGFFAVNPVTHRLYFPEGIGWSYDDSFDPVHFVSDEPGPSGVVINKVELNAVETQGTQRAQWVELYNSSASVVDISGWTLTSTRPDSPFYGATAYIPEGTALQPGGRYVVETADPGYPWYWLVQNREVITLRDDQGRLVDWTPELTDDASAGTAELWQRSPEGRNTRSVDDWAFATQS